MIQFLNMEDTYGDEALAQHARREGIRQEMDAEQFPSKPETIVAEDLELTRHRILTGLPRAPMACWRW